MFDMHTHILPFIDDGSPDVESSLKMIKEAIAQGITDIVLTPHKLRTKFTDYTKHSLEQQFQDFQKIVANEKLDVALYLGQEISYHNNMIKYFKNDEFLSLNNSNYILFELPFFDASLDYDELIYMFSVRKFKVVFAHVERYNYLSLKLIKQLKELGALIQINSNSVTGKTDKVYQKNAFTYLKHGLVDFVASDVHLFRVNDLKESKTIIEKKFGFEYANQIFHLNGKILFDK